MESIKTTKHLLILATVVIAGCPAEPRSCSLDPNSADPAIAACASEENVSCVVNTHPQCNGEVCVRWRGEPGFCTAPCKSHADCGEFEDCTEVVLASGEMHCVSSGLLD